MRLPDLYLSLVQSARCSFFRENNAGFGLVRICTKWKLTRPLAELPLVPDNPGGRWVMEDSDPDADRGLRLVHATTLASQPSCLCLSTVSGSLSLSWLPICFPSSSRPDWQLDFVLSFQYIETCSCVEVPISESLRTWLDRSTFLRPVLPTSLRPTVPHNAQSFPCPLAAVHVNGSSLWLHLLFVLRTALSYPSLILTFKQLTSLHNKIILTLLSTPLLSISHLLPLCPQYLQVSFLNCFANKKNELWILPLTRR